MTTKAAAKMYEAEHLLKWEGRPLAIYNPASKAIADLPVIYGFNNGGSPGWYSARLLAEDGTGLGGHICSSEGYMLADIGCLEGSRPDRHETFRTHYPEGYRMAFVSEGEVRTHPGLQAAYRRNQAKRSEETTAAPTGSARPDLTSTPKDPNP